ncbi:hypothetical protein JCGZ_22417 [Jatropha curcas]|uniref:Major facilitator superfamily (MFS) profile domain-containing protein n=1 Tax=Jatropha curcas TaxID=180498 RepID=A0A067LGW1_JATCU|nr:monosaccharide-sensing protein 2 [Jatropha curcas]KDP43790.1 hypothetical protein JCGZ_22417 [Jatropha curcas]
MRGAVLVALAAAVGNMLQGWDNSTIAGSLLYIKKEFNLQTQPTMEGLIAAMSLIGATIITTFSGPVSDIYGRRPLMIISAIMYFLSGLVMFWAPNVYVLLLGRLLNGFGIGLAVTIVPVYISETAPSEIRGQLNTFPQFMGSGGMFVSYCMVFGMSLMDSPKWRVMLGVLSIPSIAYLVLTIFYLPESPRWLVSKGKMSQAKQILQRLRGREDVSGELALLVEGLGVGREGAIEEYIIGPASDVEANEKGQVKLYGTEEGVSWVAKPVTGQSNLGIMSRHGSMANQNVPFMDPLVTLFGSVHENVPAMGSMLIPSTGSMFNMTGNQGRNEQWDEANRGDDDDDDDDGGDANADSDDNMCSPLLSPQVSTVERDGARPATSMLSIRRNSSLFNHGGEEGAMGIGGGWQLAYKYSETTGKDGRKEGGLQRMYLKQEAMVGSRRGSLLSVAAADIPEDSEYVQASAIVSRTAVRSKQVLDQVTDGSANVEPPEIPDKGPSCSELFEPGVKRALIVGVGLQLLQQVSGINGVLYYTPQILEQAGVAVLLANMGLRSDSASLFISLLTALSMLPCIVVAMRLMDVAGRRAIMLYTIPVLIVSLLALVLSNIVNIGSVLHAIISTGSVMFYISFFVMGFGAIPNIICSEIFPTSVRGLCITICAMTYWLGDITITYMLPIMLKSIGLSGVFTFFSIGCIVSWIFVFLKVPETKGMPLEVISEFFAVGATAIPKDE